MFRGIEKFVVRKFQSLIGNIINIADVIFEITKSEHPNDIPVSVIDNCIIIFILRELFIVSVTFFFSLHLMKKLIEKFNQKKNSCSL